MTGCVAANAACTMTDSYFGAVRKIVVTGPESSGKTALAKGLAVYYNVQWVPEMARAYLEGIGRSYLESDLLAIARSQIAKEDEAAQGASMIVCDTDLITIRIWGEEKYGRSDPWVIERVEQRPYDLWLLCAPDMPWEPDPLRENPHDRDRLFEAYERTLITLHKPYIVMRGQHEARMVEAIRNIDLSQR